MSMCHSFGFLLKCDALLKCMKNMLDSLDFLILGRFNYISKGKELNLAFYKPLVTFSPTNQYIKLFFICVSVLRHHIQSYFGLFWTPKPSAKIRYTWKKKCAIKQTKKNQNPHFTSFTVWKLKQEAECYFVWLGGNICIRWLKFLAALCMSAR